MIRRAARATFGSVRPLYAARPAVEGARLAQNRDVVDRDDEGHGSAQRGAQAGAVEHVDAIAARRRGRAERYQAVSRTIRVTRPAPPNE